MRKKAREGRANESGRGNFWGIGCCELLRILEFEGVLEDGVLGFDEEFSSKVSSSGLGSWRCLAEGREEEGRGGKMREREMES